MKEKYRIFLSKLTTKGSLGSRSCKNPREKPHSKVILTKKIIFNPSVKIFPFYLFNVHEIKAFK